MAQLEKAIPALSWLRNYKLRYLYFDFMAGVYLAISMLPKAMAYALVAGLPPVYGLYASLMAPIIGILFGSNKLLFTGPVGVMTILVYTSISKYARPETPEYINLAVFLAFLVGTIILLVALLRATFILNLISHAAVIGFVNAASIIIIATQLKYVLGIHTPNEEYLALVFFDIIKKLPELNPYTLSFSALAIGSILFIRKFVKKVPDTLLVLIVLSLIIYLLKLQGKIELVGEMPQGIPYPSLPVFPDFAVFSELLVSAIVISIVGMAETYSISKIVAFHTKQKIDFNQEFIGQGLANLFVSLFKGYPVCGSFSGTSINWSSGARTGTSILVFGVFALLSLTVLTPLFAYLPKFMLAVIVILAVVKLFSPKQLLELYKINKYDGIVAFMTFFIAVIAKPDYGIIVGIVTALAVYMWRTMHARVVVMVKEAEFFIPHKYADGTKNCPQILILKPEGPIMYANAEHIRDEILKITEGMDKLRHVILDMTAVYYLDASGVDALRDLIDELEKRDVGISLIHISDSTYKVLRESGVLSKVKALDKKKTAISHALREVDKNICDKCNLYLFEECRRLSN